MKVLWFTNIPMPAMDERMGKTTQGSGYWMTSLLHELSRATNVTIAVAVAWPGADDAHFVDNGIEYFMIGQPRGTSHLSFREKDLKKCRDIIGEWNPDIIHIHGTERYYGLLAAEHSVDVPIVMSIQGLLSQIVPHYFGRMNLREILSCHKPSQFVRGYGLLFDYFRLKKASVRETAVIRSGNAFLGRTSWDRAHIVSLNSAARYYHVSETMRSMFFEKEWRLTAVQRHSIIFTNARNPLRNVETLLEAVMLLGSRYDDISLMLAGSIDSRNGYGKHLTNLISRYGLKEKVVLLGYLEENQMVEQMLHSHVFCNSSLVENSPNSLCEAQLLGMPCLGSYAGGIPSLIKEGTTGLLFPSTDPAVVADTISRIFSDDDLAESLGINARQVAMQRHDPKVVVNQLVSAYRDIFQSYAEQKEAHRGE